MISPLRPLTPMQRIGYLDSVTRLRCIKPMPGFATGKQYEITCEIGGITKKLTKRKRNGTNEAVQLTGSEMRVRVKSGQDWHRFQFNPFPHALVHGFDTLVEHFEIPEVPDVARVNPTLFQKNIKALQALES